jgi:hypothetical protein
MSLLLLFPASTPTAVYTKESKATLPTAVTDLATTYTPTETGYMSADDTNYSDLTGAGPYLIHQYKNVSTSTTAAINGTWIGRSTKAGSAGTITLQIYNHNTAGWETLASNTTVAANTDFTLAGTQSTNITNYISGGYITFRVYQAI